MWETGKQVTGTVAPSFLKKHVLVVSELARQTWASERPCGKRMDIKFMYPIEKQMSEAKDGMQTIGHEKYAWCI